MIKYNYIEKRETVQCSLKLHAEVKRIVELRLEISLGTREISSLSSEIGYKVKLKQILTNPNKRVILKFQHVKLT